uniref:Obscurin like cytoskeletal adaptor 1a n=1 Tax=Denticeps clupeoides TaxID=299321 RepID=A0AAY4B180_9TELE
MDVFGGAPRVLSYPRPVVVQSGMDALLQCKIGGDPRPDVFWERKNEPILSEGRYQVYQEGNAYLLSISHVTTEDSGQYICKAKNSVGETYAAATLKVEDKTQEVLVLPPAHQLPSKEPQGMLEPQPRFLIKPLSLRVDRGEDAAFSCKLWGQPLPEVVWGKDGKRLNEIYESAHYHVGQQDGGWFQLKIYRTRAPDGGVYTCKAINAHGEAVTGAVLLVEPVPEIHDESLQNEPQLNVAKAKKFAVSEGKHAKFRCYVTGKPKPEIVWKKDGIPIKAGRRHMLFEDREGYYTLKVLYCKQQDAGLYICAASNALGDTLSAVHLSVKGRVQFIQGLQDVEVKERDMAVLECEVPEERISTTWYLEDQKLQPDSKYRMEQKGTRRRLTIHDVGADDDGVYLCEMPDGGRSIAELAVKGTIVQKMPRKLEVLEGENAAFCVELEEEDIDVHWFKDGLLLHESHQTIIKYFGKMHILVFVNTSYQDSGTITLVAGRSKTSCRLRVKGQEVHCPPACPVGVKMSSDTINGVVLSWDPSPNLQTTTKLVYLLERQEVGSQEWQKCMRTEMATTVEVVGDSVPYEGNYRFRICCINKYGHSGHVEFPKVVHLVPGPKIKTSLKNAMVSPGDDALFSIELSTSMIGNWFLNSTQLKDSESLSISHSKNQHSLIIRNVSEIYNGAEITFIANGVRDSAMLQVEGERNLFTDLCFTAFELVQKNNVGKLSSPGLTNKRFTPLATMEANKKVEVGDPIVLYCEVSNPLAKVHWFKNGVELQRKDGLNIQSEGNMRRIVIQSAEVLHSGAYTCQARGDTITFSVDIPEEERQKTAMELDPVVLHCEVSRMDATVQWMKNDGLRIKESENIRMSCEGPYRRLTILCSNKEDSGEYVCETAGDSVFFQLTITEPLVYILSPTESEVEVVVCTSEYVELACEISHAEAEVFWFRDGVEVDEDEGLALEVDGSHRRLVIPCASMQDSGEYICETANSSILFLLTVEGKNLCVESAADIEMTLKILFTTFSGEPIVLECKVSRPNAQVCWMKDTEEVQQSSNITITEDGLIRRLTIHCAELKDSGKYTCDAKHEAIDFPVKIAELPVKILRKADTKREYTCMVSDDIVLECELSRANGKGVWYKDGVAIQENERFCLEEEQSFRRLIISCIKPSDSGKYTCNALAALLYLDLLTHCIQSAVPRVVEFLTELHNTTVLEGEDASFKCIVSPEDAQVVWLMDGERVSVGEKFIVNQNGLCHTLLICKCQICDTSKITAEAEGVISKASLKVQEAQVLFTKKMALVEGEEFGEATLETEVSLESGEVQWMRQGVVIQPGPRHTLTQSDCRRCLTIHNLSLSDRGTYRCETLHDRTQVKLNVEPRKITIYKGLVDTDTFERETASFEVELSHTDVEGVWQKDGLRIKPNNNWRVSSNGRVHGLTLSNLTLDDTGTIVFLAEGLRTSARLQVKETPVGLLRKLSDARLEEGSLVILECELSRTNVEVKWLKIKSENGRRIYSMGRKRCLQLQESCIQDSGLYSCHTGELSTSCNLEIYEDLYVQEEQNAVFMCEVSIEDIPGDWYKNGSRIRPSCTIKMRREGTKHFLLMCNVQAEDSGEIMFVAKQVQSTAYLEVEELPARIVKPLRDRTALQNHRVILECTVSTPRCNVTWYRGDTVLEPSDRVEIVCEGCYHKLVILQVMLEDEGTYSIEVRGQRSTAKLMVEGENYSYMKQEKGIFSM